MLKNNKLVAIFEEHPVRRIWDEKQEKWYFSVVDVVAILSQSSIPKRYWSDLKNKLKEEGSEVYDKIVHLKLLANDGKYYASDTADIETVLRLVQAVPSPKAEPLKLWLAKVGYERLKETVDPQLALDRARNNWQELGHSSKWIEQRMRGQEIRNKLTDYWADHEVTKEDEYAKLTNIIHKEWSGIPIAKHKEIKKLSGHNLRDHMTDAELIFTALAELSTHRVAENEQAVGFNKNAVAAVKGGRYAGKARKDFEKLTGQPVVNKDNFLENKQDKKKIK